MNLLSSKVSVVEEAPKLRGIPSLSTSIAAAVGVTERGPIAEPVLVSSFEEFTEKFGGFVRGADLPLAALGFFENGGSQLWVVRTVHFQDVANKQSHTATRGRVELTAGRAAPGPAELRGAAVATLRAVDGDTLVLVVDGGPPQTLQIEAQPATLATGGAFPTGFAGGETLQLAVQGEVQEVAFEAGDQSAADVAARINATIRGVRVAVENGQVVIRSDVAGTSARLEALGGTALAQLAFAAGVAAGAGNVADSARVALSELLPLLNAMVGVTASVEAGALRLRTVAVGRAATLQVDAASTLDTALGLDNDLHTGTEALAAAGLEVLGKDPGSFANGLEIDVSPASNGETGFFDFTLRRSGIYLETFLNVTMAPAHDRYIETVVNHPRSGSYYVRVRDLGLAGVPALDVQRARLSGGGDGLAGIGDRDFIGSPAGKTGLHALDTLRDFSLLIVPGRATAAVHSAMVRYCEVKKEGLCFAVLDPPAGLDTVGIIRYLAQAGLSELSEHAAIYWPRVKVNNPAPQVLGPSEQIVVAASGILAGVYARTDGAKLGGVYDPPAGIERGRLFGVLGFETDEVLEERKRDLIYPKRINPLTSGPGLPRYIDGSRTLKGGGNFPYVAERRGVSFIERSLKQGLQFARHQNNTESLRAQVRRTITAFLIEQMNAGAFRSRDPDKAFFVDVSEVLNTPLVIFSGRLIARVGLATNKPAEFIVLKISQDTRGLPGA